MSVYLVGSHFGEGLSAVTTMPTLTAEKQQNEEGNLPTQKTGLHVAN